ncbi:MAG: M28 family peptidase [Flavobacteriaceae bacterium]
MNKLTIAALSLFLACNSSQKTISPTKQTGIAETSAITYAESIDETDLKRHLYIYASDEYEGRETGTPGQKKAVEYIREQYKKLGIPAAKPDGDYFQKVPLEVMKVPTGAITLDGDEKIIGEDFLTFSSGNGIFDEVQYLGYGIEDENYSDFGGIDVSGKLVLVKSGEPKNEDGTFLISGSTEPSKWSDPNESIEMRGKLLSEKGAKGMLYIDAVNYGRFNRYFQYMKNNDGGQMSINDGEEDDFFEIYLSEAMALQIVPDIANNDTPYLVKKKLVIATETTNTEVDSENVAAILKGSEKPDEYVVISSHLDHIGINADGQINNGADDDGSGTVALLEIAEAFKKAADAGNGPKRSIVFLHVTGEEKGLLGSQYYTDIDPIFPLSKTVANLNIDMIGRIDPERKGDRNYIYLIGSDKLSTDLHLLSEEVNQKFMNIELDYTYNDENDPNRFYYRSDHYNFAKNNIPIIFYFNGTHADYHRPGDTPDKINYDLLQNRSRLVFHTAWEVANREARIVVDKVSN